MDKVLLKIIGTQRVDGHKEKIEMATVGAVEETGDAFIVSYDEQQEPPQMPVNVRLTVNKDGSAVELVRSGPFDSCLIIEKSKRNLCPYGTQYGDILMGIYGHMIDSEYAGDEGKFEFSYDIDINGVLLSRNEVKMTLTKQNDQE